MSRSTSFMKTGNESVEKVAARQGYADGATLRTLLRRQLNVGIEELLALTANELDALRRILERIPATPETERGA
jgi:hypothetical protein